MPASARFAAGKINAGLRALRAATAMGSTPCMGGMPPSSDKPPTMVISRPSRWGRMPEAARMPSAMGRSNAAPILRTSAGARLTVTRPTGNGKPELRIAERTRSRLSLTVVSGRPTMVMPGNPPPDTSTSTETGSASTPNTAAAWSRANMRALSATSGPAFTPLVLQCFGRTGRPRSQILRSPPVGVLEVLEGRGRGDPKTPGPQDSERCLSCDES